MATISHLPKEDSMRFTPHVTVATLIEDQGRFLMVEEMSDGRA
eukprot:gene50277-61512_t